jgi:hypothetical protein
MKNLKFLFAFLTVLFGSNIIFAQTTTIPDWVRANEQKRREMERINNRNPNKELEKTTETPDQRAKRVKKQRQENEERSQQLDEINQKLAAPVEYRARYAAFLRQDKTGITRMFPDKDCGKGLVVDVKELERCKETPQIKGAGSLYSIKLAKLPDYLPLQMILGYVGMSDIHFVGDKFVVGSYLTEDIISDIGDVNLDEVNLKSEGFKFLKDYKTAEKMSELSARAAALEKGIDSNGFFYSNSATVKLDSVYVLRSIAYRGQYRTFWNTDDFIVFKVVGREQDGSVVFIWKRLRSKDAPELVEK